MIRSKLFAVPVMALAFVIACDTDDDDGTGPIAQTFTASLSGANERPNPVTTPATGSATFTLSADENTLTWNVTVTGSERHAAPSSMPCRRVRPTLRKKPRTARDSGVVDLADGVDRGVERLGLADDAGPLGLDDISAHGRL